MTFGEPLSVPDEVPGLKYYGIALAILLCLCLLYAGMLLKTAPGSTACPGLNQLTAKGTSTVQFVEERKRMLNECDGSGD